MPTQVDFYLLPDEDDSRLQNYACKIAKQAWLNKQKVLIQTEDKVISQVIDERLWVDETSSFIPHAIQSDSDNDMQDILISHHQTIPGKFDLLINLSARAANIEQSPHIIELLNQQNERKKTGREHYKMYRQMHCELQHHELKLSDL